MEWLKENRKITIYIGIAILIFVLLLSVIFFKVHINLNKTATISYIDSENIDYKVAYKDNEYYKDEFIEKDNQYIASLIEHIVADFKYDFEMEEDLEYKYKYKVVANVNVIDSKSHKTVYKYSEDILEEKNGDAKKRLNISENIKIDFNKYNNLISKFVRTYNLGNVTSEVNFQMKVGIEGENFKEENIAVMGLDIPLTEDTMAIDTKTNAGNANNLITLNDNKNANKNRLPLGIAITLLIIDLGLLVAFIALVKITATDEDKYNGELRKIMNNYDTFITKIEDEFCMDGYKIYKVQSFVDLLELRDSMHTQIIMMENTEQLVTCFVIPTNNNILYFYSLSVKQYALPVGKHAQGVPIVERNEEQEEMRV